MNLLSFDEIYISLQFGLPCTSSYFLSSFLNGLKNMNCYNNVKNVLKYVFIISIYILRKSYGLYSSVRSRVIQLMAELS
jgi:hypothetical protein